MNENRNHQEPSAAIPTTPTPPPQATALTRQLIRINSTGPGAYEGEIGHHIASQLTATGVRVSTDQVLPSRFNVMGRVSDETDDPALIYIYHMGTVVVGDGWSVPPLSALERDGRIYGRGTCDMKSGLACAPSAFSKIATRATAGQRFRRTFYFIAAVDEEDFMRDAGATIRTGWITKGSWVLGTKPANGQIQVAHKGRIWFELTVTGAMAHVSTPWKGADAITSMTEIIVKIREQIVAYPSHPELGSSAVAFGQVNDGCRPYVVLDSCTICIDMHLVLPTDTRVAAAVVEGAIHHGETTIPGTYGAYTVTGDYPYVGRDNNSYLLIRLTDVHRTITASETDITYFPGYIGTVVIVGLLYNHNCMPYGPGDLELVHKPDESVPIGDILRHEQVLAALANQIPY